MGFKSLPGGPFPPIIITLSPNWINECPRSRLLFGNFGPIQSWCQVNFDQRLFYNTYNGLEKTKTFKEIFEDVFIPLLQEIGLLWQTDTITTAHEHFLTSLIRQKILVLTEQIQSTFSDPNGKTYVLFLPDNEVHELGIMYLNYLIVSKGFHSIFLGQSVPIDGLVDLLEYYDKITFISFFTSPLFSAGPQK